MRVRRAILAAIDRKAMIDGAVDGFGTPIGSFYVPGALGYVDTTGINPYDPEKAKKLLEEAGVTTPLELSAEAAAAALRAAGRRGPRGAARQGRHHRQDRERRMGAVAVAGVRRQRSAQFRPHHRQSHVEPFDLVKFTEPDYYLGYNSEAFNELYKQIVSTPDEAERAKLLGDAQRMLATDAVAGFLYQPQWITITNKKLKGVWKDVPQFENDFSSLVLGVAPARQRLRSASGNCYSCRIDWPERRLLCNRSL